MHRNLIDVKIAISIFALLITSCSSAKLKFSIPQIEGCAFLGPSFENATLNECGYCVGPGTNLSEDYGKDCKGECFGDAQVDCSGKCDGEAYIDECTGICIKPSISNFNGSVNRDCRGMCIPPELSRPQQQAYDRDECGICRLQKNEPSLFIDCQRNCQLPGIIKVTNVCGQCVNSNHSLVLDECGNCRSERKYCSCDRDPSICGCNDPNGCYNTKLIIPFAVPNKIQSKLLLVGYFYPFMKDLNCLFRLRITGQIFSFPVMFIHKNKTSIECLVNLEREGDYHVGVGLNHNFPVNHFVNLVVYDIKKASINSLHPIESYTSNYNAPLKLKFKDSTNLLPLLPLKCKIIYSDSHEELTPEEHNSDSMTCILPPSKRRLKSQNLLITPTYDGVNTLSIPFTHTIKATQPTIANQNCYISEDGLAIVIIFEKPIDINKRMQNASAICEYLFTTATFDYLKSNELQACIWASKIQLLVLLEKPISENSVVIKFNKEVLREDGQDFAIENSEEIEVSVKRLSVEPSWLSYEPKVTITGPSEIPRCGSFALIGHFSSPKGTKGVQFVWEVSKERGEVSIELRQYVENNGKTTNLLLTSSLFEYHIPYKFIFKAIIAKPKQTLIAKHALIRVNYDSPIVSIYHTTLLQATPLTVDQEVSLFAEVSVPECVFPVQKVIIFWKVIDPRILFPFVNDTSKRSSILYKINPYSIPVDQPVSFYLNSFFGYQFNETSGAGLTLIATKPPFKAVIADGSPKIAIGAESGNFILSGKNSQSGKRKLVYQWSCHEGKTAQPCYYNFGSSTELYNSHRDTLLITRQTQNLPELILESSMLEPNKEYWFGLQVFDANNSKIFSETEYTLVKVTQGNAPQVFIGSVYIKGKYKVPFNPRLASTVVPANVDLVIEGRIKPANNLTLLKWESTNSIHLLNWNHKIVEDEIHTELHLHKHHIVPFGSYLFKLTACISNDECSEVETSLTASQGVSMCQVVVEPYIEYEQTGAFVQNCNTPLGYGPLTYQLYFADEELEHPIPVTVPQFSSVLTFPGTPVAAAFHKQLTRFGAQVCDKFGSCTMFFSNYVHIEKSSNEIDAIENIMKIAKHYNSAGDSIAAMSALGSPLVDSNETSNSIYEKVVNDTIEYAKNALDQPSQLLTQGHLTVAFHILSSAIHKTNNTKLKQMLLAAIQRFIEKSLAHEMVPDLEGIKMIYNNVMTTFRRNFEERRLNKSLNHELLLETRRTYRKLAEIAASQVQLGTYERLGIEEADDNETIHDAITEIYHHYKIYDVKLRIPFNKTKIIDAHIKFGDEVKRHFNQPWNCGQERLCQSVVFSVTIFPNDHPFPILQHSIRLTPVIEITIHAPNTGKEQKFEGLLKAATFQVTLTEDEDNGGDIYVTRCHFFDEKDQTWKIDGVYSLGLDLDTNSIGCWTGHLSTFAIIRVIEGISADYVIGVLVAVCMGVLVFGIMVVFFVQRKKEESARVTPQPPQISNKNLKSRSKARLKPKPKTTQEYFYQSSHKININHDNEIESNIVSSR